MESFNKLKEIASDSTILIVEDHDVIREEIARIFTKIYKNVLTACNGKEGLELYRTNEDDISLVITDINMPEMNGLDMSKKIRNIDSNQAILVLSAHDELPYVLNIVEIGINQFIPKPYTFEDLIKKVYKIERSVNLEQIVKQKNSEMKALLTTLETILYDDNFDKEMFSQLVSLRKKEHEDESILKENSLEIF